MSLRHLLAPLTLALALTACADAGGPDVANAELVGADGKADGAAELRVRIDGLTLWLNPALTSRVETWQKFTLTGRTSRNLEGIFGFIPDDPFGEAQVLSARKFAVDLSDNELFMMTAGLGMRLQLDFAGKHWFALIDVEARLGAFAGSSKVWADSSLAPVQMNGKLVHRTRVHVPATTTALSVTAGKAGAASAVTGVARESATTFRVDLPREDVARAALSGAVVTFTATDASGKVLSKSAGLTITVTDAQLTAQDAYIVWPYDPCDSGVAACLAALPGCASGDTESCGTAREVSRCASTCPH